MDIHDAENRQCLCRMIIWHVKKSLDCLFGLVTVSKIKFLVRISIIRVQERKLSVKIALWNMAIKNNINDLQSMKTVVWAAYFHLLSSNDSPQHGRCPVTINALCQFQKTEAVNVTKGTVIINTHTTMN
ncbi:hypothetical protein TNCV_4758721 [Trichonephila clavipes]|nr:hypothetical protein TNCV_4758721 [Trichonephila clavipes]